MSVIGSNALAGASGQAAGGGYAIERSVRLNLSDSAHLNKTPSSAGNRQLWTYSVWVKRARMPNDRECLLGAYGANNNTSLLELGFDTSSFYYTVYDTAGTSTEVFRDPSAWQHVVIRYDGSNLKFYSNGSEVYSVARTGDLAVNGVWAHKIGSSPFNNSRFFDGYLADVHFIDGQALAPTDFGELDDDNVWQPKKFDGTYGTNGFHLDFKDNSSNAALGYDAAGSNNWTVNNLSVAAGSGNDSVVDSPTNGTQTDTGAGGEVVGNYATLNPLITAATTTLSNGNLDMNGYTAYSSLYGTIGISSGKYYWETTYPDTGTMTGVAATPNGSQYPGQAFDSYAVDSTNKYNNNVATAYHSFAAGSIVGCAFDADNGTLTYYDDGVSAGIAFTSIPAGTYFPILRNGSSTNVSVNFGQRAFSNSSVPSGYKSLNTANLPPQTIADGSKHFDVALDTGANILSTATSKTNNAGFVWIKDIVNGSQHHILFNSVDDAEMDGTPHLWADDDADHNETGSYAAPNGNSIAFIWDAGSSNTTIAAGSLNSSLYNQAQAWNSQVTGTSQSYNFGGGGLRGSNNWFDGDIKHASSALSGNTIEWSGSIAFTSSFAIASDNDGVANAVNITHGPSNTVTNVRSQLPNTANSQLAAGTIPLTTLTGITSPVTKISCVGGASGANGLTQVVVDGRMLVDSGITLANVPSIASTVRANPTAGCSIVKYIGNGTNEAVGVSTANIGHGLNATPSVILVRATDKNGEDWSVYHSGVDETAPQNYYLALNKTDDRQPNSGSDKFSNIAPTSSIFTVGSSATVNRSTNNYTALLFAPVEGYSAFGSYAGGGSTNVFVHTGMSPKFIIIKCTNANKDWLMFDTIREPYNETVYALRANLADIPDSTYNIDILSNGFVLHNDNSNMNASGNTYTYMAFASNPFKTARAR